MCLAGLSRGGLAGKFRWRKEEPDGRGSQCPLTNYEAGNKWWLSLGGYINTLRHWYLEHRRGVGPVSGYGSSSARRPRRSSRHRIHTSVYTTLRCTVRSAPGYIFRNPYLTTRLDHPLMTLPRPPPPRPSPRPAADPPIRGCIITSDILRSTMYSR